MNLINNSYNYILASKSPRRAQLLKDLGLIFRIETAAVEEIYPDTLAKEQVPVYLAEKKAQAILQRLSTPNELIIAADTIVLINSEILGKPNNKVEAAQMLSKISGNTHQVITGVALCNLNKTVSFRETTIVTFKYLNNQEINYYIDQHQPYDKAGSYAIQEWIGMIGIQKIEGCYYNVVGLPVQKLYKELSEF